MKVVFVHLGSAKAAHLWENLRRLDVLFPKIKKVLILDNPVHLPKIGNLKVELFLFSRSNYIDRPLGPLNRDIDFREGFWQFSIERFMALNAWHRENPIESFVHVESDVLLMPDFPWERFTRLNTLAWLRYNDTLDVAAILYSPNSEETGWLADLISREVAQDPDLTDMTVLSRISHQFKSRIMILPTQFHNSRLLEAKDDLQYVDQISDNVEEFGGIFDAAAIGMWLTGQDPRNYLGWIKRYVPLPSSFVNPAIFEYSVRSHGTVTLIASGKTESLFNLHLHSKQLSFFGQDWESRLRSDVKTSKNRRRSRIFSWSIFATMAKAYLSRNQFFSRRSLKHIMEFRKASR